MHLMQHTSHRDISLPFKDLPYTRHVTEAGLAKETDLYFMGVVERGTGRYCHWRQNWLLLIVWLELDFINKLSVSVSSSQLVSRPQWCWVPVIQRSLLFSPSLSAGRESAVDALMTTFEYEHCNNGHLCPRSVCSVAVEANYMSSPFNDNPHDFSHTLIFYIFRPWKVRSMCSKMNYKDHVQDTSSLPIRFHACVSAWMCIWRPKAKMIVWRDHESSPVKRCACALSGTQLQKAIQLFTHIWSITHSIDVPLTFLSTSLNFRGPNRLKPFKYNHPQGFFSHR